MDPLAIPSYRQVKYFIQNYGVPGTEDSRTSHDFMVVEPNEMISSFRAELLAMSKGNYSDEILDQLVGPMRRQRHGSYSNWAKSMLLWMAEFKG